MVKDEADVIEHTLRRLLSQVDRVLIADNASSDRTREILGSFDRVIVLTDPEVGYYQSEKMTALAAEAVRQGARWIVPWDADEVWYSPFGTIRDVLAGQPDDVAIVAADLYDHRATATDTGDHDPVARIGWRNREPAPLPKVAVRGVLPVTIEQGNHGAHYPTHTVTGQLVVRHFPYRSAEQFVRKAVNGARAYAATDRPEHEGKHWRDYGRLHDTGGPAALEDVFRSWFWEADPTTSPDLLFDPCPL